MDMVMDTVTETRNRKLKIQAVCIIILFLICGCKHVKSADTGQVEETDTLKVVTAKFTYPEVPSLITDPNLQLDYFIRHYWDHFDFADTTYIPTPEITEQAWVDYIDFLNRIPLNKAQEAIKAMMSKSAQNSKKLFLYFTEMADKYLYEPNSPAYNEEFYIPVLEVMVQTPALDDIEKIRPQYRLDWAYRNRIGTKASDFQYAGITGQSGSLYQVSAEYTLLFFNDPECKSCKDHIEGIRKSVVMSKLIADRKLKVLSIYSDQNVDEWKTNYASYPSEWINGYDPTFTIGSKFDLKASPTLYLLGRDKTVILKDAPLGLIENYLFTKNTVQ